MGDENTVYIGDKKTEAKFIYKCIYCLAVDEFKNFNDEHVIPDGLGGQLLLKNACCNTCQKIISKANYERNVQQGIWQPIRVAAGIRKRRRKKFADDFVPLRIYRNNKPEVVQVSASEVGCPLVFIQFPLPAYLTQQKKTDEVHIIGDKLFLLPSRESFEAKMREKFKITKFELMQTYDPMAFGRLLAKIGYGYVVYFLGLEAIKNSYVLPIIMDKSDEVGYWVGCSDKELKTPPTAHTDVEIELKKNVNNGMKEIYARIKIFASLDSFTYLVVVGEYY